MIRAIIALALAGCAADLPAGSDWVDWAAIDGQLAPTLGQPPTPAVVGETMRVVSFNVELGADVPALADAITGDPDLAAADVLLLQEIEDHPDEAGPRAARLAEALQMGFVYAPARTTGDGTHGLAILSRLPIDRAEVMRLPRADLMIRARDRIAVAANIAGVRLVDVHLDTRINVTERILQLRPAVLGETDPVVVGGDFNTNPYLWTGGAVPDLPGGAVVDTDQAALLDDYMRAIGYATPTAELGPTQDAVVTRLRLDALYPRGVDVVGAGLAADPGLSDHRPLWVDVAP